MDSDEAKRAACKFLSVKRKEECEIQYKREERKLIFCASTSTTTEGVREILITTIKLILFSVKTV